MIYIVSQKRCVLTFDFSSIFTSTNCLISFAVKSLIKLIFFFEFTEDFFLLIIYSYNNLNKKQNSRLNYLTVTRKAL